MTARRPNRRPPPRLEPIDREAMAERATEAVIEELMQPFLVDVLRVVVRIERERRTAA